MVALLFMRKCGGQWVMLIVAIKNKWFEAWTHAWFYYKVPLIWSLSPGQGRGLYALHSYMIELDFVAELPFECPDEDIGDVAFVKATRTVGGRDAVEEYMASGLFPLSVSFSLGEVSNGETLVSMLSAPMPDFHVARLPEETNDGFRVRVELAAVNVVGRYTRSEHKVYVEVVLNQGKVNHMGLAWSQALRHVRRLPRRANKTPVLDP
jgi:hypothetical protein